MRTQDFIRQYLHATDGKFRNCSSVCTDGNGNFYSYGYHYPLLVKVGRSHLVNTAGYSATTGKHISWAARYADGVYDYEYIKSKGKTAIDGEAIMEAIMNERLEVLAQQKKLTKRATRKREMLINRAIILERSFNLITQ